MMTKATVQNRQIWVELNNTTTGQEKVVQVPDSHDAVTSALTLFARIEGVSVRMVDIRLSPVQYHA
jgi:hypothetical protein